MDVPFRNGAIVVTSISGPNEVLKSLAAGSLAQGNRFFVIGDTKSPTEFHLKGCDFYSISRQRALPFTFAQLCHEKSYTRKNIGYLLAIQGGAEFIVETDDDNFPLHNFWAPRNPKVKSDRVSGTGWLNAYRYFSDAPIYPRGFPLEQVGPASVSVAPRTSGHSAMCPVQQGLANRNPDVDAIYRMLFPLPIDFEVREPLILAEKLWCPFNSQNTTTFPAAYPLLYLPTYCTFRMTDIWRSFVAQRICWTCGWNISFHSPSVYQKRNEHDLLNDFADEVPGYLNNAKIARALDALSLPLGTEVLGSNMKVCYQKLIEMGLIQSEEMNLLEAWLSDLTRLREVAFS